ncbi:MAG TPA: hypothetical protein DCF89_10350 [Flavobacteriales bacterium]|mgnify:CR=1 FL=1|nr:hypothetical protein [Flavobacteriales bacterium]|tara:strand:+ start:2519 stop:2839 length:321 start_codon:yes stop_codon:yes gene_type:complete
MSNYPHYIVDDVNIVTALIGGCAKAGDEWILPEGKTLPSQEEIDAKREELKAEYDAKKYQRDRQTEYPAIGDQLDMLFHAIDAGTLDKSSDFYTTIKAVKDKYPKG